MPKLILKHTSRNKFVINLIKSIKKEDLSNVEFIEGLAKAIWDYASDEWSKGYGLGIRNYKDEREEI